MRLPDPVTVIETAIRSANHGDITNMVSLFADDAVVKLEPPMPPPLCSAYHGRQEIEQYLRQLVTKGFHVEATNFTVVGDVVSWQSCIATDLLRNMGVDQATVKSQAVVDGALIRSLTIHYSPEVEGKLKAAAAVRA